MNLRGEDMPEKIVKYINVYKEFTAVPVYDTEREADSAAGPGRIARVKLVEVERRTFMEETPEASR